MSLLESLPTELWIHIAQFLEGNASTLRSLTFSNRKLHAAATDILYRNIELRKERIGHAKHQLRLVYLLRTLLERPELGEKIRSLHLSVAKANQVGKATVVDIVHQCDNFEGFTESCSRAVHNIGCLPSSAWAHGITRAWETALGGVLLALLPRLRDLHLTVFKDTTLSYTIRWPIQNLFGSAQMPGPMRASFGSLQRLDTHCNHLRLLSAGMKNLKSLAIDMADLVEDDFEIFRSGVPTVNSPADVPNLEFLTVYCDTTDFVPGSPYARDLPALLSTVHVPKLKRLDIRFKSDNVFITRPPRFQQLIDNVKALAPTLEHLSIGLRGEYEYSNRTYRQIKPWDALRDLELLKTLEAPWEAFVDRGNNRYLLPEHIAYVLPDLVQSIRIVGPDKETLQWLETIAQLKHFDGFLQHLQTITLVCVATTGKSISWFREHGSGTWAKLANAGIEISFAGYRGEVASTSKAVDEQRRDSLMEEENEHLKHLYDGDALNDINNRQAVPRQVPVTDGLDGYSWY